MAPYEINASESSVDGGWEVYKLKQPIPDMSSSYELRLYIQPKRIGLIRRRDGFRAKSTIIGWTDKRDHRKPKKRRNYETREAAALDSIQWAKERRTVGGYWSGSIAEFVRILTPSELSEKDAHDKILAELEEEFQ